MNNGKKNKNNNGYMIPMTGLDHYIIQPILIYPMNSNQDIEP